MNDLEKRVLRMLRTISPMAKSMKEAELLCAEYLDDGIIDSLQFIEFVAMLEKEFELRFTHEELQSQNFRTVAGIAKIVSNRPKK